MKVSKIDADEAVRRRGSRAASDEETLKEIENAQDDRFTDIYSLRFGWKKQPSPNHPEGVEQEEKLMTLLPNGKACFPDRSQKIDEIIPEDPYICLVYERPREAFAKILFPEYQPKIYILPTRIVRLVYRTSKGKMNVYTPWQSSYEERIIDAVKQAEKIGLESLKIVFRKNIR